MSFTFLKLVQRLRQEAGVSGADPVTCQGLTGEMGRLVNWINDAWFDIQNMHPDWFFLRQNFSFNTNTVTTQQSYTPVQCGISNFGEWKKDSCRIYSTASSFGNEMILPYIGWDEFRNLYLYSNMRTTLQRPVIFSIDPQYNFVLGSTPDLSGYTINGECYAVASYLVNDADIPIMPAQFHMLIVWKALEAYGKYDAAEEVVERAQTNQKSLVARLQSRQLPAMTFGASLA